MKKILSLAPACIFFLCSNGQTGSLTVEKIMRDPKWIGTSPSDIFWNYNSQSVYFKWNPENKASDSFYYYQPGSKAPVKAVYTHAMLAHAVQTGTYDHAHARIAYAYRGNIFLLPLANPLPVCIAQGAEPKSDPVFCNHDKWIVYSSNGDLYAWNIAEGTTRQLTDFIHKEQPEPHKPAEAAQWLADEQLRTSSVIRERKEKREAMQHFIQQEKGSDTLRKIYIGDKDVDNLQISPGAEFITYNLTEKPAGEKATIVPNYVTQSGFTADIPSRSKAGFPQDKSSFYIFDRIRDTIIRLNTDSIPGISDRPAFEKDYPAESKAKPAPREVFVLSLNWNDDGSAAIADIRSRDNKDRWLLQLDPATGRLSLLDRQHDEAWIAGPGIGWLGEANIGWINNHEWYFQSEVTGYSHLYSYDLSTHTRKAITQGSYEVQQAILSRDKKHFYLLTNEEHPGKLNFYRIKTDGTGKEKLTSMDGSYEAVLSPDEHYIAYRYSTQTQPWELLIQENTPGKKPVQATHLAMSDEWKAYPWRDTKIFTFPDRDRQQVYARIYEPAPGKKNNAAVIFVHGAGYLQNIFYGWSYYYREYMFNNLLADKGYTVMDIDYRASAGYGRDWRTAIYRYMGGKDLDDEVDAARWLVKEYGIDSTRIGIYGGSYGGFMTLMALFTQPDIFKAGAALRPVTDWAHYNDDYTSAILNEPTNDSIAYQRSSPINFAAGLKNHLLICHGMVDVNVHFQDVVRLVQRLIELGKNNWDLAVYPVEDHGFVEPSSWTDEYKRILKLFDTYLK